MNKTLASFALSAIAIAMPAAAQNKSNTKEYPPITDEVLACRAPNNEVFAVFKAAADKVTVLLRFNKFSPGTAGVKPVLENGHFVGISKGAVSVKGEQVLVHDHDNKDKSSPITTNEIALRGWEALCNER